MMSVHNPDKWVIVGDGKNFKVLGGWSGGYLDGDSWRLSSGLQRIEQSEDSEDYLLMHNYSGSIYKCHKNAEGTNLMSGGILAKMKEVAGVRTYSIEEFNEIKNAKESDDDIKR